MSNVPRPTGGHWDESPMARPALQAIRGPKVGYDVLAPQLVGASAERRAELIADYLGISMEDYNNAH